MRLRRMFSLRCSYVNLEKKIFQDKTKRVPSSAALASRPCRVKDVEVGLTCFGWSMINACHRPGSVERL